MNVGQLKKIIEDLPPETPVLVPGEDHSYYSGHAWVGTAVRQDGMWFEDYDTENNPDEVVHTVLIVEP